MVTDLLRAWSDGDPDAPEALLPLVYDELRRQAAAHLRSERRDHTLGPTALVHEAYLRLLPQRRAPWRRRAQFHALASRMMRRVLIDYARTRAAAKRPNGLSRVDLDLALGHVSVEAQGCDLLLLDQALRELADLDRRQSTIVELSYFGGVSEEEIASTLSISRSTVARELRSARAWIYRRMTFGRSASST